MTQILKSVRIIAHLDPVAVTLLWL